MVEMGFAAFLLLQLKTAVRPLEDKKIWIQGNSNSVDCNSSLKCIPNSRLLQIPSPIATGDSHFFQVKDQRIQSLLRLSQFLPSPAIVVLLERIGKFWREEEFFVFGMGDVLERL